MVLIDSHCHLADMKKDYVIPDDILPVTVGYSHTSNCKTVEWAKKFNLPFVLGIAPQTAMNANLDELEGWIDHIIENKPNAIGEIGLDYHWPKNEEHVKKEKIVFKRLLEVADNAGLPIVIHARKATTDVLDILETQKLKKSFMMHFFSGDLNEAKRVVDMGGLISITPIHSKQRRTIINSVDIEYIVVETDAPYVGRTPEAVKDSINYICDVKNIDFETIAHKTAGNAMRFFNIKTSLG